MFRECAIQIRAAVGPQPVNIIALLLAGLFSLYAVETQAQDVHYSQFFYSPVPTNPAHTGFFPGKYRVTANYRDQFFFVDKFYKKTSTVAFDARVFNKFLGAYNIMAFGLTMNTDQADKGHIGSNGIHGSIAYHQNLLDGNHYLVMGFQFGIQQWGFDPTKLLFGDQITNGGAITSDQFLNTNLKFTDVNAGFMWNYEPSNTANMYVGFSYHHLNRPQLTFTGIGSSLELSSSFSLDGGGAFELTSVIDLMPSFIFTKQDGHTEINMGSSLRFNLQNDVALRIGTWGRFNNNYDALILFTGIDYYKYNLGFSYDASISRIKVGKVARGSYEIAIVYIGGLLDIKKRKFRGRVNCPIF